MRTLGFSMILYPTSLLLTEYEQLVNVPYWATIEKPFSARQE